MSIIKKSDIIDNNVFDELIKEIEITKGKLTELVGVAKNLNKEQSGAGAKAMIDNSKALTAETNNLIAAEKLLIIQQQKKAKEDENNIRLAKLKIDLSKKEQSEIDKLAKEESKKADQAKKAASAYNKLTTELNELRKSYKDLAAEEKHATVEGQKLLAQITKLDTQLKKIDASVGQHQRNVGNYASAWKGLGTQILSTLGIMGGIDVVARLFKSAWNVITGFTKNLSELQAITGASGKDLDFLSKSAREMASQYGKSAKDIVEAMKLVGSAKPELLSNVAALSAMTESVLILSQASGMDLASATSNLSVIMNQFGHSASKANEDINILAAGSKFGSVEVGYLADSISKVGSIAKTAGLSLETVTAVMELFGEKGIQAETAGRGFKTLLIKLQSDTKNYTNGLFDLNKAIDNNIGISGDNIKMQEKFGTEFFNLAQILFQNKDRFLELNKAVTGTNTAFEQAAIATNNISGDIDKLTGSWDRFMLSLEEGDGVITTVIRGAIKSINNLLTALRSINEGNFWKEKAKRDSDYIGQVNKLWDQYLQTIKRSGTDENKAYVIRKKLVDLTTSIKMNEIKIASGKDSNGNLIKMQADKRIELELQNDAYRELITRLNEYKTGMNDILPVQQDSNNEEEKSTDNIIKKTDALKERNKEEEKFLETLEKQIEAEEKKELDDFEKKKKEETGGDLNLAESLPIQNKKDENKKLLDLNKEYLDARSKQNKEAAESDLKIEKAKQDVIEQLYDSTSEIAKNYTNAVIDDKLQKTLSQAEAEKDILKDKLDKGLISEQDYNNKLLEIDRKTKTEEAKAERKKALYSIAVDTAVAVVKALGYPIKITSAIIMGALQAAAVASKPLPKFGKGQINIKGKSHSQGGILAEIEGNESVISKLGTSKAPIALDMINKGLLTDNQILNQKNTNLDSEILTQLIQNNKTNNQILNAVSNGVYQYTVKGITYTIFADGSRVLKSQ